MANWNGAHHLRLCLPSLLAQSHRPAEIIVVDNGSTDDSANVTEQFAATWMPLTSNVGLAPALNQGARVASGDFLLFVNNDMRFDPGLVAALLEPFSRDDRVFASDGMQFDWDGNNSVHLAARLDNVKGKKAATVELTPALFFYPQTHPESTAVFMGSAACMLVRKSVFMEIGQFDDRLPLGYEDVEICWRAGTLGWKTMYVPGAICWHHVGASGRSLEGARLNFRGIITGRLLLATKFLPIRYTLIAWLVSILGMSKDLSRKRWIFAKDRLSVLVKLFLLTPQLRRERKVFFRAAGITPEQQLNRFLQLTQKDGQQES